MITTSILDTCLTITFLNLSFKEPTPEVWVCANREAFESSVEKLTAMKHIKILKAGNSHIAR